MVNVVPNIVRETWDDWNIRGVILVSLGFQIFLILFSPLRKRISSATLTLCLWLAYLLADYCANLCIGLIFDKRNNVSTTSVKDYIVVFWAPFLLLHLGGPDTITAFSLEDNELWRRHLLSLIFQLIATVYVFLLTIPGNTLWLPTVLVFFAGIIKYIERTRSLYLASMDTFRKSIAAESEQSDGRHSVPVPDTRLSVSEHDQQLEASGPNRHNSTDYVELVRKGYEYFKKFKGFVVDKTYNFVERNESREYFLGRTAEDALALIEVELNFIYEYFFTKAPVLRTKIGYVCRFGSFSSTLAALLIFFLDKKHGFSNFDVRVTYILLLGAVILEFVALFELIFSDWTAIRGNVLTEHFIRLKKPKWSKCKKKPYTRFEALSTNPLFRRWSGTISEFGLRKTVVLTREIRVMKIIRYLGVEELVGKWMYKANNPFIKELWVFIFSELQKKSGIAVDAEKVKTVCEARGGWSIQNGELEEQEKHRLMRFGRSNEVAFEESLLIWSTATNVCFIKDAPSDQNLDPNTINDYQYFSKVLSNYMFYLLIMEPAIISAVAGIGPQRLLEFEQRGLDTGQRILEGQQGTLEIQPGTGKILQGNLAVLPRAFEPIITVLNDTSTLTEELMALEENKRWKILAQVWVEMLSYAAINCRPDTFVQQLSQGGQLISFVWLLMLHLGLGTRQFKR